MPKLIRQGFNEEFQQQVDTGQIDINGRWKVINRSYLELCISAKNVELAEYLIKQGANIGLAIHDTNKDLFLIDFIIKAGGDINQKNIANNTLIYEATMELVSLYDHKTQSLKYGWGRESDLKIRINTVQAYITELVKRRADPSLENTYGFNCHNAARNLSESDQKEIKDFFYNIINNNP